MLPPTASCEVIDISFPRKLLPKISTQTNPYIHISTPLSAPPCPMTSSTSTFPSCHDNVLSATHSPYVSISTPPVSRPLLSVPDLTVTLPHSASSSLTHIRHAAAASLPPRIMCHPQPGNRYTASLLRPPVPADHRVIVWTTPHSLQAHASLEDLVSPRLQLKIFEKLLSTHPTIIWCWSVAFYSVL